MNPVSTDFNKNNIEDTIHLLKEMKKDFESKNILNEEYHKYCLRYLDDAIFDLKGVLYYLQKE